MAGLIVVVMAMGTTALIRLIHPPMQDITEDTEDTEDMEDTEDIGGMETIRIRLGMGSMIMTMDTEV